MAWCCAQEQYRKGCQHEIEPFREAGFYGKSVYAEEKRYEWRFREFRDVFVELPRGKKQSTDGYERNKEKSKF